MKLLSYVTSSDSAPRAGVLVDDEIVDLESCGFPAEMKALLQAGLDLAAVEEALPRGTRVPLASATLSSPVPNPGKILAIGLNYADHIEETGMKAPKHQIWFNKQHNCANGPYDDIRVPSVSEQLDYEAELCVVIGKRCKHVPRERAHEVIAGYCCGNDVSVRDWQRRAMTMQIGKSFDTHGPMGPWLVTPDEVGDPHALDLKCLVNDEVRQSSNTRHLIFDCYDAIAHLTQAFTLDPGDVLFTGTPSGVAHAMEPTVWLKAGDVVRVEIEKLGYLENTVVDEAPTTIIE